MDCNRAAPAMNQNLPVRLRKAVPPPLPPEYIGREDSESCHPQDTTHAKDYHDSDNETLDNILYNRFGFVMPLGPGTETKGTTVGLQPLEWRDVVKTVGDRLFSIDNRHKNDVCRFLTYLLQTGTAPASLWDLSDSSHCSLRDKVDTLFQVTIKISRSDQNEETFYIMKPIHPSRHARWELVLQDPATVLECRRRQWGPNCDDIARHLLERGMAFSTHVPPPSTAYIPKPSSRPPAGLGWRYPNYQPDAVDYSAYEYHRATFFRLPHARAALLKGGILWRLAKEHLKLEYPAVLTGPSEYVYEYGRALTFSDGQVSWDDDLSEQEMDLICGVYKIYTGQSQQTADVSWWPKHSAWRSSGLNVGYWTPDCETWFQNRVQAIRSGTALPRSGAQWKKATTYHKKAAKLANANQKAAALYLAGTHFP